jgi:hypothetical protein
LSEQIFSNFLISDSGCIGVNVSTLPAQGIELTIPKEISVLAVMLHSSSLAEALKHPEVHKAYLEKVAPERARKEIENVVFEKDFRVKIMHKYIDNRVLFKLISNYRKSILEN